MRLLHLVLTICLLMTVLVLNGCASSARPTDALDRVQYAWSGAIRWGDFEGARNLVDPEQLKAKPMTALQLARYEQVQISSYRDVGSNRDIAGGTAVRDIEIGVINRHTLAERTVRYRENWRWDAEARTWWLQGDLPDLWDGQ
ncbi:MAG: hypothetical protein M3414_04910 [Pseudomonadota bacterium]|nr:hypothetical protein [Pseudomonadota bacterium]